MPDIARSVFAGVLLNLFDLFVCKHFCLSCALSGLDLLVSATLCYFGQSQHADLTWSKSLTLLCRYGQSASRCFWMLSTLACSGLALCKAPEDKEKSLCQVQRHLGIRSYVYLVPSCKFSPVEGCWCSLAHDFYGLQQDSVQSNKACLHSPAIPPWWTEPKVLWAPASSVHLFATVLRLFGSPLHWLGHTKRISGWQYDSVWTIIHLLSVVLPLIARDPTWEEFENTEAD